MKNYVLMFLMFLTIFTLSGCASVSLQDSWKDPNVTAKPYQKILIVGIADKTQMRQIFEEVFESEITKKGTVGIASYTITGVKDKPSRAALEEAVKKSGADAVITARMVSLKKKKDVRTGFVMTDRGYTNTNFSGAEVYPTDLYSFYGGTVAYATFDHKPVEVTTSTRATIETNLFDTGTGRLVWSGTSSAVDPEGVITFSKDLANTVIKAMSKDGLL
jgi:hypothetical protein